MAKHIKDILREWFYRLPTGYAIQPYNQKELHILEQILAERGIDPNPIVHYLREMDYQSKLSRGHKPDWHQLHTSKFEPFDDIDEAKREPGTVWKTKTGWAGKNAAGESQYGMDSEEAAKAYVAGKEEKPTKTKLPADDLLQVDKASVKSSLEMTNKKAKAQAIAKGKKDVGAGTPESRAGEAMVHTGIQMALQGKSFEEIEAEFTKLVNSPDHVLNKKEGKKWVPSAIGTLKRIEKEIGFKNIQNVAWDTDQGRQAIGVDPKVKTSSDAFIQKKDGTVVGISLKKTGTVFINSGGWETQSNIIINNLKNDKTIDPKSVEALENAISIKQYNKHWAAAVDKVTAVVTPDQIKKAAAELTPEQKAKHFAGKDSPAYFKALENPSILIEKVKSGNASVNEKKAFAKILKAKFPTQETELRNIDNIMNDNMYIELKQNQGAQQGLKKHIVKSLHVSETLGLNETTKAGGINEFITLYGEGAEGAVLNESTLSTLLGSKFTEKLKEVRAGNATVDDLNRIIEDSIEMDYENKTILFKHENNKQYPLFTLKCRTKGLGGSPTMEMAQTRLMATALTQGTFNSDDWTPEVQEKFKKDIKQDALEEMIINDEY